MARSQSASRGYGYGRSGYVSGLSAVVCASAVSGRIARAGWSLRHLYPYDRRSAVSSERIPHDGMASGADSQCRLALVRACYVMLSGAFLLDYRRRYTTREFYSKRFAKVAVPFVAWTVIYLVWSAVTDVYHIYGVSDVLAHTVAAPAMYHLWFFYMILGLYAVTPILSLITQSASRPLLWAFVVVCFTGSALGLVAKFSGHSIYGTDFTPSLSYVGYFVLGWLLRNQPLHIGFRALIYVLGAASIVLTAALTMQLSLSKQVLDTSLLDYQLPAILFESAAVFVFIRSLPWERILSWRLLLWLVQTLALSSFGIYLAHVLLKYYVNQYTAASLLPIDSTRYILLGAPLIYVLTAVIIVIARRVPWSYWLIP